VTTDKTGQLVTTDMGKAEVLNKLFASVFDNLSSVISVISIPLCLKPLNLKAVTRGMKSLPLKVKIRFKTP